MPDHDDAINDMIARYRRYDEQRPQREVAHAQAQKEYAQRKLEEAAAQQAQLDSAWNEYREIIDLAHTFYDWAQRNKLKPYRFNQDEYMPRKLRKGWVLMQVPYKARFNIGPDRDYSFTEDEIVYHTVHASLAVARNGQLMTRRYRASRWSPQVHGRWILLTPESIGELHSPDHITNMHECIAAIVHKSGKEWSS